MNDSTFQGTNQANSSKKEQAMTKFDKLVYPARVYTTGGRDGGASRSDDVSLNVTLTTPGTDGAGTNPEQLFAAAWSACFLSAVKLVASKRRMALPADAAIDAEVDLVEVGGMHRLTAHFNVLLPGVDHQAAEALADAAHHICPYSNATRGNVGVTLKLFSRDVVSGHRIVDRLHRLEPIDDLGAGEVNAMLLVSHAVRFGDHN